MNKTGMRVLLSGMFCLTVIVDKKKRKKAKKMKEKSAKKKGFGTVKTHRVDPYGLNNTAH